MRWLEKLFMLTLNSWLNVKNKILYFLHSDDFITSLVEVTHLILAKFMRKLSNDQHQTNSNTKRMFKCFNLEIYLLKFNLFWWPSDFNSGNFYGSFFFIVFRIDIKFIFFASSSYFSIIIVESAVSSRRIRENYTRIINFHH